MFAVSPSENAYMYSMKMSFAASVSRMPERAPATFGTLRQMTSVSMTAKLASCRTSTALSTSETIRRRIPKSAVSAMLKAFMLIPLAPRIFATSFMRPVLFSRNTDNCLIVILFQITFINYMFTLSLTALNAARLHQTHICRDRKYALEFV